MNRAPGAGVHALGQDHGRGPGLGELGRPARGSYERKVAGAGALEGCDVAQEELAVPTPAATELARQLGEGDPALLRLTGIRRSHGSLRDVIQRCWLTYPRAQQAG